MTFIEKLYFQDKDSVNAEKFPTVQKKVKLSIETGKNNLEAEKIDLAEEIRRLQVSVAHGDVSALQNLLTKRLKMEAFNEQIAEMDKIASEFFAEVK